MENWIRFFISASTFWDMKITFPALVFRFAETETCPLFANREPQCFSLFVSNWGAIICCQNVRQETTTKADPLYHRLFFPQRAPTEWIPFENRHSPDARRGFSLRVVFPRSRFVAKIWQSPFAIKQLMKFQGLIGRKSFHSLIDVREPSHSFGDA